jgi:serine/threonine-protein kinase
MGTLAYCSPEQMEGKKLDNRSDIYSLGVMMYEMLTLEMPIFPENSSFGGWYKAHHNLEPRPFEDYLKLPSDLKGVIMKCMAKSPDDRPQNVGEILTIIQQLEKSNQKIIDQSTTFSGKQTIVAPKENDEIKSKSSSRQAFETKLSWPTNKPQQKIVFPKVITTSREPFASLWVMLEKEDILNRISSLRYNQFLFLSTPHPMILWLTVIYNSRYGARWLPCYLDLKTDIGQQVVATLAELGSYKIFFFSLEEPRHCQHTMTATIAPSQCRIMQDWLESSKNFPSSSNSQISRRKLRHELEKLKPKILMKLQQKEKKG